MNTKISTLCDKLIEACWLAAVILSPLYMNIYTHRMFEPDKANIIRSLALLSIVFYIIKVLENKTVNKSLTETRFSKSSPARLAGGFDKSASKTKDIKSGSTGSETVVGKSLSVSDSFIRNPIFIGFALFAIAYIISVIYSPVPHSSIWGGYDRLQGLYTNASFWLLFIFAAINIKTKTQVNRLISTIIFTSVPIVVYGFIQRFGWDPVPWQQMNPAERVSATMGNPIFLSAYLIMTIPLTFSRCIHFVERAKIAASTFITVLFSFLGAVLSSSAAAFVIAFIISKIKHQPLDSYNNVIAAISLILIIPAFAIISKYVKSIREKNIFTFVSYGFLTLLQITTIFLSQSRGPMIGMFAGLLALIIFYAWSNRKKVLLASTFGAILFGIIFVGVFNLPHIKIILTKRENADPKVLPVVEYSSEKTSIVWKTSIGEKIEEELPGWWHNTFGKLMNIKYVRQFGRILEKTPGSSGRTRIILWKGVWKLINDKDEPHRFFIGYGPESLATVYYKNYTMELAALEGANVHADRTHNAYLDIWVMNGLLGLIAFVILLISLFYISLKTASARKIPLGGTVTIPLGGKPATLSNPYNLIIIGLISAIISHLVEIVVGIPIVSTLTHFWILTGAIYATYRIRKIKEAKFSSDIIEQKTDKAVTQDAEQIKSKKQKIEKIDRLAERLRKTTGKRGVSAS